jgi:hypothetical protein
MRRLRYYSKLCENVVQVIQRSANEWQKAFEDVEEPGQMPLLNRISVGRPTPPTKRKEGGTYGRQKLVISNSCWEDRGVSRHRNSC